MRRRLWIAWCVLGLGVGTGALASGEEPAWLFIYCIVLASSELIQTLRPRT